MWKMVMPRSKKKNPDPLSGQGILSDDYLQSLSHAALCWRTCRTVSGVSFLPL
jgi:hypothetical protein